MKYLLCVLLLLSSPLANSLDENELLDPDQAFAFSASLEADNRLRVTWQVADGYYMYRERIRFSSPQPGIVLGAPEFPRGKIKDDEFFGRVEIYRDTIEIQVPVERKAGAPAEFVLEALSQGCADVGVCYPPHNQRAALLLADTAATLPAQAIPGMTLESLDGTLGLDTGEQEFLPPDEAFRFTAEAPDAGTLVAHWDIADGYYLYREKFRFELKDGAGVTLKQVTLPPGKPKEDEFFGRIQVFYNQAEAVLELTRAAGAEQHVQLVAGFQGCAEAGICYPPQTRVIDLLLPPARAATGMPAVTPPATTQLADEPVTEQDRLARILTQSPLWLSMLLFFGLGIGLAFTPCVFPMIPILSSIIIGQGEHITTRKAFTLSLVYVLAMALTYTAAGVIAGMFGQNLQAAFQNPWILGSFATVFVLLALSMFGFYELQMPAAVQNRLADMSNRQQGGSLFGVAIMGFLSALIVGPCVAAPLAGALLVIGQSGDAVLGGSALFALSMGMGAPLLAIGTGFGKVLPRAGVWMDAVKAVFGVLLLMVALWMLERILPMALIMVLWAILLIASGVYLGALDSLDKDSGGWRRLWKGLGLVVLVYGVLLLVGAASGGRDLFRPLQGLTAGGTATTANAPHVEFRRVKSLADLQREIGAAAGKTVVLDFYADWCTDCKRMEKYTFSDPQLVATLNGFVFLQADVTTNDDTDKQLLSHFNLIGPPSILFFGPDGEERRKYRLVGFLDADKFTQHALAASGS